MVKTINDCHHYWLCFIEFGKTFT